MATYSHHVADDGTTARRGERCSLYTEEDPKWLSKPLCIVRAQLEAFAATAEDVEARSKLGGANSKLPTGRVGIRCIHCAHLPADRRPKGSGSYPNSIRVMHQAVRNWQRYHLPVCEYIPQSVKDEIEACRGKKKSTQSKKKSEEYWIKCCERMGMHDADTSKEGIRFMPEGAMKDDAFNAGAALADLNASNLAPTDLHDALQPVAEVGPEVDAHNKPVGDDGDAQDVFHGGTDSRKDDQTVAGAASTSGSSGNFSRRPITWSDAQISATLDLDGEIHLANSNDDGLLEALHFSGSSIDVVGLVDKSDAEAAAAAACAPGQSNQASAVALHVTTPCSSEMFEPRPLREPHGGTGDLYINGDIDKTTRTTGAAQDPTAVAALTVSELESMPPENTAEQHLLAKIHLVLDVFPALCDMCQIADTSPALEENDPVAKAGGKIDPCARSGLFSLGEKLYELFAERQPYQSTNNESDDSSDSGEQSSEHAPRRKKRETRSGDRAYIPLRELGFPVSLCDLVSSLLERKDGGSGDDRRYRYQSAGDVREDLRLLSAEPCRFLFDQTWDEMDVRLNFPRGALYGREEHVATLMNAHDRVIVSGGPCEMILASGYSGTGKTSLMQRVQDPLTERGGFFITGKFDELRQAQPLSAIVDAFNEYCDSLVRRDAESLDRIRTAIKGAVGGDAHVLTVLIPQLCKVIGEPEGIPLVIEGMEAHNRIMFLFRKFLRVISSPSHPIILFLDDLQWADDMSLELIRTLVTDKQIRSFLFLGCYRDNEVAPDHPLSLELQAIKGSSTTVTTIDVGNITKDSVNALISDTLHLLPSLTRPLAGIVFNKTRGNALFVTQFLRSLCEEGLLCFSLVSRRWEWDVEAIRSKNISENVVELLTRKILKLDTQVLWGLKMASCLGIQCDESALKYLDIGEEIEPKSISPLLDVCVDEGLMSKVGTSYKFSHDQIRLAAYSLIPTTEHQRWHLQIGRLLRDLAPKEEMGSIIFVVVDQLERGSELITDHDEKLKFARLCLLAGKKAIQSSAFMAASIHLLQGTALVDESDWGHDYDLMLELFTCCAEAQFTTGSYDGVTITLAHVFTHSKCLQDSIRPHLTLLSSLGSRGRPLDAIKYGLGIVADLGETFPSDINQGVIMKEVAKTQALLGACTTDAILETPLAVDKAKIAAVLLLGRMTNYAFVVKQELMPLFVCRMVQISLSYGLCKKSAAAFAAFASILSGSIVGLENGYRCGKLAISLLEKLDAKEDAARVHILVYGQVNPFKEPLQACLEKLKEGYGSAMLAGDIVLARMASAFYAVSSFQTGRQLEVFIHEVGAYTEQLECFKNRYADSLSMIYMQAASNLAGLSTASEDPTALNGGIMNQDDLMNDARENQDDQLVLGHTYFARMCLAYIFGRYDVAGEMVEKRQALARSRSIRINTIVNEVFYSGLIAATLARRNNEAGWRMIAHETFEKMKPWAEHSKWNCQHKLEALRAEIAYLDGDLDAAANAYDVAIESARNHGFVHEQALICERAGVFYSEAVDPQTANGYFARAYQYYLQWGAKRKASDLLNFLEVQGGK